MLEREMYKKFGIRDFRCFHDFGIDGLKRVNLITGTNNVGKTAFLEAIFLHSGSYNPELAASINGLRGLAQMHIDLNDDSQSPLDGIFRDFITEHPIRLDGAWSDRSWSVNISRVRDMSEVSGLSLSVRKTLEKSQAASTKMPAVIYKLEYRREKGQAHRYFLIMDGTGKRVEPTPPISGHTTRFHLARGRTDAKAQAILFSNVQRKGEEAALVEGLRTLESRLKGLAISMEGGDPMLHGDIGIRGHRLMPLALMGDGMARLLDVLVGIANTKDGVFLVDEIEIGWHHSVLIKVWGAILKAAETYNVQLFCTTHSLEAVRAAYDAFSVAGSEKMLAVYRFERKGSEIIPLAYDNESLVAAFSASLEIR